MTRRLVVAVALGVMSCACGQGSDVPPTGSEALSTFDVECMETGVITPGDGYLEDGWIVLESASGSTIQAPKHCAETWQKVGGYEVKK